MRISDWSSDVCSSDLFPDRRIRQVRQLVDERPAVRACAADREVQRRRKSGDGIRIERIAFRDAVEVLRIVTVGKRRGLCGRDSGTADPRQQSKNRRTEEHQSELQSLMRNSYADFCLKNINIYYYTT